jgi:hypothetical protein
MSITQEGLADIFAVLQPLVGDADLYVSVEAWNKTYSDKPTY